MKTVKIERKIIGNRQPFFIAEAGLNHNGKLKIAKEMVRKASEAGADAIKFQTFKTENLYPKNNKAYKIFKKFELTKEQFGELKDISKSNKIIFCSTPFDFDSVDLLENLKVPVYKIASSDLNFLPLIQYVSMKRKPIIISSGMGTEKEIQIAIDTAKKNGAKGIVVLHCVSGYPTPLTETNLNCIPILKKKFNIPIGYSDNGKDTIVNMIAATLGADVIEKHFTLNSKQKGADHNMSIEPKEMKELISNLKNIRMILGNGKKHVQPSEVEIKKIARRGIYARKKLIKGETITKEKIKFLRPPNGIKPTYHSILSKKARKNFVEDDSISFQ